MVSSYVVSMVTAKINVERLPYVTHIGSLRSVCASEEMARLLMLISASSRCQKRSSRVGRLLMAIPSSYGTTDVGSPNRDEGMFSSHTTITATRRTTRREGRRQRKLNLISILSCCAIEAAILPHSRTSAVLGVPLGSVFANGRNAAVANTRSKPAAPSSIAWCQIVVHSATG